jgi:hypothetical protein
VRFYRSFINGLIAFPRLEMKAIRKELIIGILGSLRYY